MNTKTFKKDLRAFLENGNSQSELARKSGVSQSTISQFVNNDGAGITLEYALKLCPFIYGESFTLANLANKHGYGEVANG